MSHLLY